MSKKINLTGLWKSKTKEGKTYLRGNLTYSTNIFIFENGYKKTEKDPDFFLSIAEKEEKQPVKEEDELPF